MFIGRMVENLVYGVLWLSWKAGAGLGLTDDGLTFGPGTPVVMPDEFAPVVPFPMPEVLVEEAEKLGEAETAWVGHTRSKTLHRPACRYAPPPDMAQPFDERASAEEAGFRVCKVCCPD